ncbi:hypothetical protein KIPB_014407 [Kipferlia bialata]|uniref:Uncharacterized protein n=1 Tax=Kipferlia bialata TaxID=797122 RepID=A0A9K3GQ47_9EUKA|nr:hypothetical protein KIPB_014407 [Kipferlia bialata]|eukprot:g14407.t1
MDSPVPQPDVPGAESVSPALYQTVAGLKKKYFDLVWYSRSDAPVLAEEMMAQSQRPSLYLVYLPVSNP